VGATAAPGSRQASHSDLSVVPVPTVELLGVRVGVVSLEETARLVVRLAREPPGPSGPHYVCATSVHGLIEASEDPRFRDILNRATVVTPDGMPLVWLGRMLGAAAMTRVYGPDLTLRILELTAGRDIGHFFYGGAPGVADELGARMATRFPGVRVAGAYSPPYRELTDAEVRAVAERINQSGARIVWVGLSTPKQERWIDTIRPLLDAGVLLSVGAAFDFHTGRVRQAPPWIGRAGLEWLYRLVSEPRRLWRRYAYNNPRYVYLAVKQLLNGRN
jgi:N-acetylglucosaminyldiphosphoundecaprenol N-acetyl-beta-D-mannosaminyltransferase